jgi:hypothetical protein
MLLILIKSVPALAEEFVNSNVTSKWQLKIVFVLSRGVIFIKQQFGIFRLMPASTTLALLSIG